MNVPLVFEPGAHFFLNCLIIRIFCVVRRGDQLVYRVRFSRHFWCAMVIIMSSGDLKLRQPARVIDYEWKQFLNVSTRRFLGFRATGLTFPFLVA